MGKLLFSPIGRIGPTEFQKGAVVLISFTALMCLSSLVSGLLFIIFVYASAFLPWCWTVLWIKRFHDAGKSGWMCLVPIAIYFVLALVTAVVLYAVFMDKIALMAAEVPAARGVQDMYFMQEFIKKLTIPYAAYNMAVSGVVAFGGNRVIKKDGGENQYGPAA